MVTDIPQFESNPVKEKSKETGIERRMSANQIAALLEQSDEGDPYEIPIDGSSSTPSIIFADELM